MSMQAHARHRVWDLPSRLAHWALAVLVLAQFASGLFELLPMSLHVWCGYAVLTVALFRVLWGFFGSETARFRNFLRGPAGIVGYLRSLAAPPAGYHVGHNPMGGWSVVALLAFTIAQAGTGLFAGRAGAPLRDLADGLGRGTGHALADVHEWLYWLLLLLVVAHVAAAVFYLVARRQNLIAPMFGDGRLPLDRDPALRFAGNGRALVLLAISAAAVAVAAYLRNG
jgi:cytochrome b